MVKINDRVYPFLNMTQTGTIVSVRFEKINVHMIGGTVSGRMYVTIRLDKDGSLIEYPADEVMRCQ